MPLINDDDRKAYQQHLISRSKRASEGTRALEKLLPLIASQMVLTVKETFYRAGIVRSCSKTFQVDESTLFAPIDRRDEMLSNALAQAFELPTSAFRIDVRSSHEATCYMDIDVTFLPPLK